MYIEPNLKSEDDCRNFYGCYIALSDPRQASIFVGQTCGWGPERKLMGIGYGVCPLRRDGGSVGVSKSRLCEMRSKESIVFLKSDETELILNPVCEGNVTKTEKAGLTL